MQVEKGKIVANHTMIITMDSSGEKGIISTQSIKCTSLVEDKKEPKYTPQQNKEKLEYSPQSNEEESEYSPQSDEEYNMSPNDDTYDDINDDTYCGTLNFDHHHFPFWITYNFDH